MLHYLQVFSFPVNQTLDPTVYFNDSLWHIKELFGVILVLLLAVIAIISWKKHKPISFGIWWFFATHMLESSIIPIDDPIVEHRMYLPSIGLIIAISYVFWKLLVGQKKVIRAFFIIGIPVVLIATTVYRNTIWKSDITLWTSEVEKNPDNHRAYNNLGYCYLEDNQLDSAYRNIKKALELKPGFVYGLNNMGEVLMKKGDTVRAMYFFNSAIEKNNYLYSLNNMALYYYSIGNFEKAQYYVSKSLLLEDFYQSFYIQYLIFKSQKDNEQAVIYQDLAKQKNPDFIMH